MTCKKELNTYSSRGFGGKIHKKRRAAQYFSCPISDCPATEQTLITGVSLTPLGPSSGVASKPNDASEDSVLLHEQVPSHTEFSNGSDLESSPVTEKTQVLCEIKVNISWKFVLTETESD